MPLLQWSQILGYLFKSLPVNAEANAGQYQWEMITKKARAQEGNTHGMSWALHTHAPPQPLAKALIWFWGNTVLQQSRTSHLPAAVRAAGAEGAWRGSCLSLFSPMKSCIAPMVPSGKNKQKDTSKLLAKVQSLHHQMS